MEKPQTQSDKPHIKNPTTVRQTILTYIHFPHSPKESLAA